MRKEKLRGHPFKKGNPGGPGRPPKLEYITDIYAHPEVGKYLYWRWPIRCKECDECNWKFALDEKYQRIRSVCLSCGHRTDLRLYIPNEYMSTDLHVWKP